MSGGEEIRSHAEDGGPRLRVLVAEDNEVSRVIAVRLLATCGHQAVVVGNGSEAVAAWETGAFDLILMDLQMPLMDGFEATLAIRDREKAKATYTPIIALTANSPSADEARCRAAGMDAFMSKPVRLNVFAEVISSVLERRPGRVSAAPLSAASQPPDDDVFDLQRALETVDGEREVLEGMIGIFTRQTPRVLADIDGAIARGDASALENAAHKLKGSVAMFSARAAREAAQRLEDFAQEGDLADVAALREALGREIERLESALASVASGEPR